MWQVADLVVLAMQMRDIEKGKGERDLSYWLLLELLHIVPGDCCTLRLTVIAAQCASL